MILESLLPRTHPYFTVTNEEGRFIEPPREIRVRDANDFSHYVEHGPEIEHMKVKNAKRINPYLPRGYCDGWSEHNTYNNIYLTKSYVNDCWLENSFLYDVQMDSSRFDHCHIHFTENSDVSDCTFNHCTLTANSRATIWISAEFIHNCTIKGNFIVYEGPSTLQGPAKLPEKAKLPSYEVYNNVVLNENVVTALRGWVFRLRQKQRFCHVLAKQTAHRMIPTTSERYLIWTSIQRNYRFSAKTVGKQPMTVRTLYPDQDQLEIGERRFEWSVERVKPKKTITYMDLTED